MDKVYTKQKVNVILDTNIWLYLSNGFEQLTNSFNNTNFHFELLKQLQSKQANQEITILVTEVIIKEWSRNKHHAEALIQRRNNRITDIKNKFELFKKNCSRDEVEIERQKIEHDISRLQSDIENNIKHIEAVEKFLKTECYVIPTTDFVKLKIWEMAIEKVVPFHNNKNNIGDASILLSTIEYISSSDNRNLATVFISNNSRDFCINKDSNDFHPELKKLFTNLDLRFERRLDVGLEISEEIQQELDYFFKEKFYENISFACKSQYCRSISSYDPVGYLDKYVRVVSEYDSNVNPNQLSLFPEDKTNKDPTFVSMGSCSLCGSKHIECPVCDELICEFELGDEFSCHSCNSYFLVIYDWHDGELEIIVKDTDENHSDYHSIYFHKINWSDIA